MERLKISKMDVARRQLETAIKMFFEEKDAVSVHTLAFAAHEILWDIGKKRGVRSFLKGPNPFIKKEKRAEFEEMVKKWANSFKHGKRDASEILEFNPEVNEFFLIDAVDMFKQLNPHIPASPLMALMKRWFHLAKPDISGDSEELRGFRIYAEKLGLKPENKKRFLEIESEVARQLSSP